MAFLKKIGESLADKVAEAVAAAATAVLGWTAYQVAPVILPAIEAGVSKRVLLALFVTSLALNVVFAIVLWLRSRREQFVLKYGIYWDRNPHCPSCKTPVAAYGSYQLDGKGYYCKPCKQVFKVADVSGRDIAPEQVISEL